jgi:hypothetical protein
MVPATKGCGFGVRTTRSKSKKDKKNTRTTAAGGLMSAARGNKKEDGLAGTTPLRALLQRDGCLTLPGVFDGI